MKHVLRQNTCKYVKVNKIGIICSCLRSGMCEKFCLFQSGVQQNKAKRRRISHTNRRYPDIQFRLNTRTYFFFVKCNLKNEGEFNYDVKSFMTVIRLQLWRWTICYITYRLSTTIYLQKNLFDIKGRSFFHCGVTV